MAKKLARDFGCYDADDALQDALVALAKAARNFAGESSEWPSRAKMVMRSAIVDGYRAMFGVKNSAHRRLETGKVSLDRCPSSERMTGEETAILRQSIRDEMDRAMTTTHRPLGRIDERDELARAMNELTGMERIVASLHYRFGLSAAQIASDYGWQVRRVRQAIQSLAGCLRERQGRVVRVA